MAMPANESTSSSTVMPSMAPTEFVNMTEGFIEAERAEEEHEFDAISTLVLNITIIVCLLLAYAVKRYRIYYLPESAGALLVGMIIGGIASLSTDKLQLFEFTFVIGIICFYAAKFGMIQNIDKENPMEALMFGSLISAVDPVATLSIMGNDDLNVDPLLYSLVFGESGVVLSHYNSYNLSETAHVASEEIFRTFATLTETIVFIYMGMGVFTGRFSLRGAIAFALSENMPGDHKEVYSTTTLSICIFTTVVCGGFTERMLTIFGMKEDPSPSSSHDTNNNTGGARMNRLTFKPPTPKRRETMVDRQSRRVREGIKGLWIRFDDNVLKYHFGGDVNGIHPPRHGSTHGTGGGTGGTGGGASSGEYELGTMREEEDSEEFSENSEEAAFLQ
eukprot:scaffold678_cov98-Cylindrotheca_fusiformis.AAC.3